MKKIVGLTVLFSMSVYAQDIPIRQQVMHLYVGQSEFISDNSITNVAVGSDEILNAIAVGKKGVLITGIKSGDTTIKVWRKGSLQTINTHVYPANFFRMIQDITFYLKDFEGVSARVLGDRIIVEGDNLLPDDKNKIDAFLSQFTYVTNLTKAKSQAPDLNDQRMVYFDVKILEVSKSNMDNLGIQWGTQINGPQVGIAGEFKKSNAYRVDSEGLGLQNVPVGIVQPFATYAGLISAVTSRINILQSQGLANLIAHPVLSCKNGGNAKFLSGGQVPYNSASATGTPSVEFKDYGIKLDVSPTIQSDGSIVAKISSEISEIDKSVTVNGTPGLLTRKTDTEFSLKNGETLVLSGLNYKQTTSANDSVPGISKAPIIGGLFKNNSKTDRQTELLFVVTPIVYSDKTMTVSMVKTAQAHSQESNINNTLLPKDFFDSHDNRISLSKMQDKTP